MSDQKPSATDHVVNAASHGLIWLALRLPYRTRVRFMGWVFTHVAAPLAGWRKRIIANLDHVAPETPPEEVRRLVREVPRNVGRTMAEMFSGDEFKQQLSSVKPYGPGIAAIDAARDAGRPIILVTGHFGNYEAGRTVMYNQGLEFGALYRPLSNSLFNDTYTTMMASLGEPIFPASRRGLASVLKHLRNGGSLGILIDIFTTIGAPVTFMGKPAPTATSAAEWANKTGALLVPGYGIRQSDGVSFEVFLDEPVPAGDPVEMTQTLNDSLERMVRQYPEQWFWIHRRWKPERQLALAAASKGP